MRDGVLPRDDRAILQSCGNMMTEIELMAGTTCVVWHASNASQEIDGTSETPAEQPCACQEQIQRWRTGSRRYLKGGRA
jgi:hypothetical protein